MAVGCGAAGCLVDALALTPNQILRTAEARSRKSGGATSRRRGTPEEFKAMLLARL